MNGLTRLIELLRDPRTPKLPRFLLIFAAIYALSPIDIIPGDFLVPLPGLIDDLILVWMSIRWLFNSDPERKVRDVTPPKDITPPPSLPPPQ